MTHRILILLALILLPVSAIGDDDDRADFEIAREAVERGEILPLATILERIQKTHPGRVIEVELEYSREGQVYEIEVMTGDGRLIEIDVDAVTGAILDVDEDD